MPDRPNIVIVILHDLGRHLTSYDSRLPSTPNITRLAEEGAVFENHFSTCPLCSPARASIQTGRYPHTNGMNGLTHRGFTLNAQEKCIPSYLAQHGYHTALYGYQHETEDEPKTLGYAETCWADKDHSFCSDVIPDAIDFLEAPHDTPFFLNVGFWEVHRPFKASQRIPVSPSTVVVPPYLPDCPEVREDLADFYGSVQVVDREMEALLSTLDETGLAQNTLVLFTTDHGAAFPRAKSTLYDPGIGVSLLARWPGVIEPGSRIKGLTSHVDLLPTLLEIIGAERPTALQGTSFVRLLSDPQARGRDYIFAEKSWHGNEYDPMRCVRTDRWKYIVNLVDGFLYQSPLDIKKSLSGQAIEQSRRKPRPQTELYDLRDDPNEFCNLSGQKEVADMEAELRHRLMTWMSQTDDPLPGKHIPYPIEAGECFLNNMDAPIPDKLDKLEGGS